MDRPLNYVVLDIENNNTKRYKRKAGNFLYDKIVAIGVCGEGLASGGNTFSISSYTRTYTGLEYEDYLGKLLSGCVLLVGHNLKHDLLFLWKYKALQDWLRRGGKIWDTQLCHYMITGQQELYPSLRDIAVRFYGLPLRDKRMEQFWTQGFQTSDIPKEEVLYDVTQDVLDTEAVFKQQFEICSANGLLRLMDAECMALLSTAEMEYQGLYIDLDVLRKNRVDLENELEEKHKELNDLTEEVWNENFR